MVKSFVKDINKYNGKKVLLEGWIVNKRSSGSIAFLEFSDGTGFIQLVAEKSKMEKDFNKIEDVTIQSSVKIQGIVKKDKRSEFGFEIDLSNFSIISIADDYPIQKKDHGADFLLDNRHLWIRSKRQWAIQRIRNTIINAIYNYLNNEGFIKIDAPILTPTACEGTSTLFPVPFLPAWKEEIKTQKINADIPLTGNQSEKRPFVYLSQSGQLYIEAAIFAHGRVFDFGPTFRAEKSKTRRHLNEFWMMDAEAAFVDHKENMHIQQEITKAIVKAVLEKNSLELSILKRDISKLKPVIKGDFPVIEHKEAISILKKKGIKIGERDDLGADEEEVISKLYDKPLFVEKYPKEIKAFYMKIDPKDESRVLNADLLAPEGYGEIIGGSQREDNYEILKNKIISEKLNLKDFQWYLDLRKYGSVVHSGFGIGLERYVRWISGIKHIRETIPFPRMMNRIRP